VQFAVSAHRTQVARQDFKYEQYWPGESAGRKLMSNQLDEAEAAPPGPATEFIIGVLDASGRLDAASVRRLLEEASDAIGLGGCIDRVVMPVMHQIGLWWVAGSYTMEQEAMTTEAIRAWLDRRTAFLPAPTRPNHILLACGPHDRVTLGLEALALLLRTHGWSCRMLGARITAAKLATAAEANDPAAVVVVAHIPDGHRRAVAAIEAVDRLGFSMFYAGGAFDDSESRVGVPGRYLGRQIEGACAIIVDSLLEAA
jgi:methanogenic corrinoid protein MtbC1